MSRNALVAALSVQTGRSDSLNPDGELAYAFRPNELRRQPRAPAGGGHGTGGANA